MPEKCKKFLKMLTLEMEDLEEDIRIMREIYQDREEKGEITKYVLLENTGLLENELAGIQFLQKKLAKIPIVTCGSYDDLAEYISDILENECHESDYPDSVFNFVEKRIQKVLKYMKEM